MSVTIEGPLTGQAHRCEPILRALPAWFGIESAIRDYVAQIEALPTFVATLDGALVGFLTLKVHTPCAAELWVMGVLPAARRSGVGRALLSATEAHLRSEGIRYLQVKTLSAADPDPNYAQTRAFYTAMGFCPLEAWPELWGPDNPCLQMVKALG